MNVYGIDVYGMVLSEMYILPTNSASGIHQVWTVHIGSYLNKVVLKEKNKKQTSPHISRLKTNDMITFTDAEKKINKIQLPFMIKTRTTRNRGKLPQLN